MTITIGDGGQNGLLENLSDWANLCVAIFALVVAIVSILIARSTLNKQIEHNKLSVRPVPFFNLDQSDGIEICLKNHGFGPFRILSLDIVGGHEGGWNLVDYIPSSRPETIDVYATTGLTDRTIPANGSVQLLKISANSETFEGNSYIAECKKALGTLSISVSYTDIYEEKFSNYGKSLAWFARFLSIECR